LTIVQFDIPSMPTRTIAIGRAAFGFSGVSTSGSASGRTRIYDRMREIVPSFFPGARPHSTIY
jgi:hypothetical protein